MLSVLKGEFIKDTVNSYERTKQQITGRQYISRSDRCSEHPTYTDLNRPWNLGISRRRHMVGEENMEE